MSGYPYLQAALNGSREHPAVPRTPDEIATDARSVIAAGARSVHVHAFKDGMETFDAGACARTLRAIRQACPEILISMTTSATIEHDPGRRFEAIAAWEDLPDLVTANQGEAGIVELCRHLLSRGVRIEAGLLTMEDAHLFIASGLSEHCERVLIEPLDIDAGEAVRHAAMIEQVLSEAGIVLPQIHHGDGLASWAVNRRAALLGHGIRTGLEDTPILPDGALARRNRELVEAANSMLQETESSRLATLGA